MLSICLQLDSYVCHLQWMVGYMLISYMNFFFRWVWPYHLTFEKDLKWKSGKMVLHHSTTQEMIGRPIEHLLWTATQEIVRMMISGAACDDKVVPFQTFQFVNGLVSSCLQAINWTCSQTHSCIKRPYCKNKFLDKMCFSYSKPSLNNVSCVSPRNPVIPWHRISHAILH